MPRKRFMVLGLGVLGEAVAKTLAEDGAEVIAVDTSPLNIENIKDHVEVSVLADATDRKTLEQLGAPDLDGAIVCIGENFEAAVLATANLLDLKVKHVAVRANSELAYSIFKRIGAHEVFFVERSMGRVIAHRLHQPAVLHEMDIGGGYRIVQTRASRDMVGLKLSELALPRRFNIQVIAIREDKEGGVVKTPTADTAVMSGDILFLSGMEKDFTGFFENFKADRHPR